MISVVPTFHKRTSRLLTLPVRLICSSVAFGPASGLNVSAFLSAAAELASKKLTYRLGGSGADGTCDCIGLIIGALRSCGQSWSGIHGSNYAARYSVDKLTGIKSAGELIPGALVFKAREKGEAKYALPERYASHPDQRDYYHVGIVISASPILILHMSSPGICRDTKLGKWKFTGCLKCVDYSASEKQSAPKASPQGEAVSQRLTDEVNTATVTSSNGLPVKLRRTASKALPWLTKLDVGTVVQILERGSIWSKIKTENRTGYIKTEFLKF